MQPGASDDDARWNTAEKKWGNSVREHKMWSANETGRQKKQNRTEHTELSKYKSTV